MTLFVMDTVCLWTRGYTVPIQRPERSVSAIWSPGSAIWFPLERAVRDAADGSAAVLRPAGTRAGREKRKKKRKKRKKRIRTLDKKKRGC